MKANELIELLKPYGDKELAFIHYDEDNSVEVWADDGETLIAEIKCIY